MLERMESGEGVRMSEQKEGEKETAERGERGWMIEWKQRRGRG